MQHFCTSFDHRYLSRGIVLYRSLERYCPDFCLWVLGLSEECITTLSKHAFPKMRIVPLRDLESSDPGLASAKQNRNLVEYYFTLTPSFPLYILNNHEEVSSLTYIDPDCRFYSDPEPIFQEITNSAVAIIGHRFPKRLAHLEKYGKYNVSWLTFRRNQEGLACLLWYRDRCQEWCHDYLEGDRYADQKYLEGFEKLFKDIHIIKHKGANLAPWNVSNYKYSIQNNTVFVDEQPLIFFHFQRLRKLFGPFFDCGFDVYDTKMTRFLNENIYQGYIAELKKTEEEIAPRHTIPPALWRIDDRLKPSLIRKAIGPMYQTLKGTASFLHAVRAGTCILARN
jgi:hypothetical protein